MLRGSRLRALPLSREMQSVANEEIHLKDLLEKEMIMLDLPITQDYFHNIVSATAGPPKIGYRTKSYEMLRSLVASRMGYAILIMRPHTNRSYDGRNLVSRPIADTVPVARYGLAVAKGYAPTRIVQAFMDLSRTTLRENSAAASYFLS